MKRNKVDLRFGIWRFDDVSHDYITQLIGISPTKFFIKGERKNPKSSALFKTNGWIIAPGLDEYASFEEQLNAILDILEPRRDELKILCDKYYCEFSCAVFMYHDNEESTPSVHLTERYNQFIRTLNVEFDLDLYSF